MKSRLCFGLMALLALSCAPHVPTGVGEGVEYARWFSIGDSLVVVHSPYDGHSDSLRINAPMRRLVCMSTSYLGYLEAFGCEESAVGVSGLRFVSSGTVRDRAVEVGYEALPDYEAILSLHPDLLLTYTVSAAVSPFLEKLRELGVPCLVLYDQLEEHPLSRAEYIRLFGALTGERAAADSAFAFVRDRYVSLRKTVEEPRKILMNIPYGDQWFIPGADSFLSQLVRDAGGVLLGSRPGIQSSVISVEEAYALSGEAQLWLHPGWCRTLGQLRSVHPLFGDFPVLERGVWNNTLHQTPGGGNDYWESGAARPDWILEDLVRIFSQKEEAPLQGLHYYFPLE